MEFALIAPLMGIILIGIIEITNVTRIQGKLNVAAGQLAEMVAAQSTVTEGSYEGPGGTLGDMCTGASYNLLPYSASSLSALIEATTVVQGWGGLQTAQNWANDTSCPTARKSGSFNETILMTTIAMSPRSMFTMDGTPTSSGGTLTKGYAAISLQLTYVYNNVFPFFLSPSITLTATGVARPRANTAPTCTYPSGGSTAACPGVY